MLTFVFKMCGWRHWPFNEKSPLLTANVFFQNIPGLKLIVVNNP